eukprot:6482720-Prymnesium_polylepis.1
MVRLPAEAGSWRWRRLANRASMPCSAQIWSTERSVYLNAGTQRTFVNARRMSAPSVERVNTGMSPMTVQRATCPFAPPNTSLHAL